MRTQKNKFWNFIFACLPGAGQMHLGFMKLGVSLMILFFGIIGIASWLNIGFLLFILPVLWFYSFFDSLNKNSLSPEVFDKLEDEFIWGKEVEFNFINRKSVRSICAALLIIIGAILLINNVWGMISYYISWSQMYWMIEYFINCSYQIVFAIVIIVLGIKLISGKKKEITSRTQNDNVKTDNVKADKSIAANVKYDNNTIVNTVEAFSEKTENADISVKEEV